jgi:hypothetical protein
MKTKLFNIALEGTCVGDVAGDSSTKNQNHGIGE